MMIMKLRSPQRATTFCMTKTGHAIRDRLKKQAKRGSMQQQQKNKYNPIRPHKVQSQQMTKISNQPFDGQWETSDACPQQRF